MTLDEIQTRQRNLKEAQRQLETLQLLKWEYESQVQRLDEEIKTKQLLMNESHKDLLQELDNEIPRPG